MLDVRIVTLLAPFVLCLKHVIKKFRLFNRFILTSVLFLLFQVMDKLVSGFGQDVLDSLYWTAVEPRGRKREHFGTLFHLIFAIVYVSILLLKAS